MMGSASKPPKRLLKILLIWTSLTTLIFWLPTVRSAFDGPSYAWSAFGFSGRGIDGTYWFPVLCSLASMAILWAGWRGARFPFHVLLVGWHAFLAIGITRAVMEAPEGFHIVGDTADVDIDLALIGPVFFGAWALLALSWAVLDLRSGPHGPSPQWTRRNTYWALGLLALLPVQFALLHPGDTESTTDLLGVVLTVMQWLLLGAAFAPRSARGLS
jgi:hypothetical protein